ncbi:MAG: hypothetical protein AAFN70_06245 [Planctomycetota bacterium]
MNFPGTNFDLFSLTNGVGDTLIMKIDAKRRVMVFGRGRHQPTWYHVGTIDGAGITGPDIEFPLTVVANATLRWLDSIDFDAECMPSTYRFLTEKREIQWHLPPTNSQLENHTAVIA